MNGTHSRRAELGENLVALFGTLATLPVAFIGSGRRFAEGVFGISNSAGDGNVRIEQTSCGIVRHHYSCCCVPPCYGCGGPPCR